MAGRRRPTAESRVVLFRVSEDYPRCGRRDAVTWVDTNILLSLGVRDVARERFLKHYRTWLRTARAVVREVQTLSERSQDLRVASAASTIRQHVLLGGSERLQIKALSTDDLQTRDDVMRQLQGLSGDREVSNGGEAELITLAIAERRAGMPTHVLLSNDAGASVVAAFHDVPTRHIGDVLRELACADDELTAEELHADLDQMATVSTMQASVRPRSAHDLACRRSQGACGQCMLPAGADGGP